MNARYVQRGDSIDYIPEADVAAGDIVKVGSLVGVAKLDIKAGELGALAVVGVYELSGLEARLSPSATSCPSIPPLAGSRRPAHPAR